MYMYVVAVHVSQSTCISVDGTHSAATPTPSTASSSQSLFSRLVNAITPASLTRQSSKPSESTPQLATTNTPKHVHVSSKSSFANLQGSYATNRSTFKTPSAGQLQTRHQRTRASLLRSRAVSLPEGDEGIELKDFSASLRKSGALLASSHSTEESKSSRLMSGSETGIPNLTLDSQSPVSENRGLISSDRQDLNHLQSSGNSDSAGRAGAQEQATPEASVTPLLRRSVRIAKRRSINQSVQGCLSPFLNDGGFPVTSVLSPVSCYGNRVLCIPH